MKGSLLFLIILLCCSFQVYGQMTVPPLWLGDVNGSETVDIIDALLTAQYYVNTVVDLEKERYMDVDQDNEVDIIDALFIAQYYVGIIEYLPGDSRYGRVQKVLAAHERMWENLGFYNYQIEHRASAFGFSHSGEILLVNVEMLYIISAVYKETGEPVHDHILNDCISVESLFDRVQEALDNEFIINTLEFNEEFGYVSKFYFEISTSITDDDVTYEILGIRGNRDIRITGENPENIINAVFSPDRKKLN